MSGGGVDNLIPILVLGTAVARLPLPLPLPLLVYVMHREQESNAICQDDHQVEETQQATHWCL